MDILLLKFREKYTVTGITGTLWIIYNSKKKKITRI